MWPRETDRDDTEPWRDVVIRLGEGAVWMRRPLRGSTIDGGGLVAEGHFTTQSEGLCV